MIAIPNMDKPKNCYECSFNGGIFCDLIDNGADAFIKDNPTEVATKVLPDCPLIDIVQCKECIHFHEDKPYIIQGIPVLGHEVCDFWGDGCKTNPNGFCSYGERRNDE